MTPLPPQDLRRLVAAAVTTGLLVATAACQRHEPPPPTVDLAEVETADRAYAEAWLDGDPDGVMATLTSDVVLLPSGMAALEGAAAARDFWWPPDSPPTLVTTFDLRQKEAEASGDLAWVRGSFTLSFEYDGESYSNQGEYLSILRRDADGRWRIARRAWIDLR